MAINPFTEVDYLEQARSRITGEFEGKDIIDRYIQLLLSPKIEQQQVLKDLMQNRSLDTAAGAQLDIIGDIVGQPRELISADFFEYFAFQGYPSGGGFGDLNDVTVGALFWEIGRPLGGNQLLDDDSYRLFIKAKIIKNSTAATPEEFIYMINFLFGTTTVYLREGQAEFTVFIGRPLTALERFLLGYVSTSTGYPTRLLPKPAGVQINFGQFRENNYFGFQGAPGAKGFGSISGEASGYGLQYGLNYGVGGYSQDIDCTFTQFLDGSILLDGSEILDGGLVCQPADGGYFAELIDVA